MGQGCDRRVLRSSGSALCPVPSLLWGLQVRVLGLGVLWFRVLGGEGAEVLQGAELSSR